jgi:hypothetical protein
MHSGQPAPGRSTEPVASLIRVRFLSSRRMATLTTPMIPVHAPATNRPMAECDQGGHGGSPLRRLAAGSRRVVDEVVREWGRRRILCRLACMA